MDQKILSKNLATVQIHFDAEKAGHWEKIKTMYTEDIVWERACMKHLVKGKEAVAAAYMEVFSALRNWDFECLDRGSPPRTVSWMKLSLLSRWQRMESCLCQLVPELS